MKRFLVLATLVVTCQGFATFQNEIPNGGKVPHPCKADYVWQGVGHQSVLGGGNRNPFGKAFKNAGKEWTQSLCNEDSDGDGQTNGEELGDPSCVWTKGDTPSTSDGLSHPGICEPTSSADCKSKNAWKVDCSDGDDFECEGIGDPDTLNITLRLDRTKVPTKETTYMCQAFELPDDKAYHLFASKPVISNPYVLHHAFVYGCPNGIDGFKTPKSCALMATEECTTIAATWTLGYGGECQRSTDGLKVGKGAFTTVLLEIHWYNPTGVDSYYDDSGLTLFITPNLRPNTLGFMITGQYYLAIPPGRQSYTASAKCKSSCLTQKITQPMYITSANLHMHYLGASGSIEQWRNGKRIRYWYYEQTYSYDLPIVWEMYPPVELLPSDEIRTICHFNSLSQTKTTYQGEATSDEMCYGFMNYYPAEINFDECISWKEYDACDLDWSNFTTIRKPTDEPDYGTTQWWNTASHTTVTPFFHLVCVLLYLLLQI